ncbi:MAG: hypothetical protein ABJC13_09220 [Acidobacteriota bacterium]
MSLPPDLFARIEASARDIAERVAQERATSEALWGELAAAPVASWADLAASGRFALPTFIETLCEESWSLPPDRSEALAQFGYAVVRTVDPRAVGTATAAGLRALVRASLGDAWRRQGRFDESDLAFLGAFRELVESEDAIDFGFVQALYSRLLRDRGEMSEAYFEALRAAQNLRREGVAVLAAGAWGEVAALAAEIGACGRVDSALKAARRETGAEAQRAAAVAVARGVLRLRLLRADAAAIALAGAAEAHLKLDSLSRADFAAATSGFVGVARLAGIDFFHAPRIGVGGWASCTDPIQEAIPMTDRKPVVPIPATSSSEPDGVPMLRDASEWEAVEGFRHTFLIHFTPQGLAASLRQAGQNLYDGALESSGGWPRSPTPPVVEQVMAGVAELRFIEGFYGMVGREAEETSLTRVEIKISNLAVEYAAAAGALAAQIEQDLAAAGVTWPPPAMK